MNLRCTFPLRRLYFVFAEDSSGQSISIISNTVLDAFQSIAIIAFLVLSMHFCEKLQSLLNITSGRSAFIEATMGGNQSKPKDEEEIAASSDTKPITTIGRTERVIHRKETKSTISATSSTTSNRNKQSKVEAAKEKRALKKKLKESIKARDGKKLKEPDLDESGRMSAREVSSRRQISSELNTITISEGKFSIDYAFCTQRGYYPDGTFLLTSYDQCICIYVFV